MAADAFIHCRVTSEVKALVRRLAERDGINESNLVKQLLDALLRTQALADLPTPAEPYKVNRGSRLYVRLAAEDWRLLKERSSARGLPAATYVSILGSWCVPTCGLPYHYRRPSIRHSSSP
jgi:hypothetical protein